MTAYRDSDNSRVLACPVCHEALALTEPDRAHCSRHGPYVRVDRIWRFLGDTSVEFDTHWRSHAASTIPEPKRQAARRFLQPVIDRVRPDTNLRILDAGCGTGVHFHVLDEQNYTGVFYGLDASLEALRQFHALSGNNWNALHADLKSLPVADDAMDLALSYGALAYSGDMERGIRELIRVVRPGGFVGIWFYPHPAGLPGAAFRLVRSTVGHLPRFFQVRVADLIVPLLQWLPTESGLSLRNASWHACRETVLVNIAPDVLEMPRMDTVRARIEERGCRIIESPSTSDGTIWIQKTPQ